MAGKSWDGGTGVAKLEEMEEVVLEDHVTCHILISEHEFVFALIACGARFGHLFEQHIRLLQMLPTLAWPSSIPLRVRMLDLIFKRKVLLLYSLYTSQIPKLGTLYKLRSLRNNSSFNPSRIMFVSHARITIGVKWMRAESTSTMTGLGL